MGTGQNNRHPMGTDPNNFGHLGRRRGGGGDRPSFSGRFGGTRSRPPGKGLRPIKSISVWASRSQCEEMYGDATSHPQPFAAREWVKPD